MSPIEPPPRLDPNDRPVLPPADPGRWRVCVECKHLRVEHSPDGARCDVFADPAVIRSRCDCSGFHPRPEGPPA